MISKRVWLILFACAGLVIVVFTIIVICPSLRMKLFSIGLESRLSVCDVAGNICARVLKGQSIVPLPYNDVAYLAIVDSDGSLQIVPRQLLKYGGYEDWINDLILSPDGDILAIEYVVDNPPGHWWGYNVTKRSWIDFGYDPINLPDWILFHEDSYFAKWKELWAKGEKAHVPDWAGGYEQLK